MIQKSECDRSTGGFCTVGPSHQDGLISCQRQQAAPTKHIPHCRFPACLNWRRCQMHSFIFEKMKHAAAMQLFFLLLIRPSKRRKKLWIRRYLWPLVDVSPMSSKRYHRFLAAMMSQVPYITVSSRRFGSAGLSRCPYSMSRAIGQINRGWSTRCQKLTSMQPAGLH